MFHTCTRAAQREVFFVGRRESYGVGFSVYHRNTAAYGQNKHAHANLQKLSGLEQFSFCFTIILHFGGLAGLRAPCRLCRRVQVADGQDRHSIRHPHSWAKQRA